MIVRVRVVLRRTVVGYSGLVMFQELHKQKVKSLRQSTSTKLILCKLIGQIPLVLLAMRPVDRFLCCVNIYVVSRSICMAQVGDVMGLWTKHNYIRPNK